MQPATDEHLATPSGACHPLDYTNLANLGDDARIARLQLLGKQRKVVSELGGRIAAELLTRDGMTPNRLAGITGIPETTIDRWVGALRGAAA